MAKRLTDKQKRFCDEYLIDLNATQAAIRAGYSERTANEQGARLLANVSIQQYLSNQQQKQQKRTEITADMVIKELALIAFSKATDYAQVVEKEYENDKGKTDTYRTIELALTDELSEEQKRALAVLKKGKDGLEARPYDKVKALELLGKHFGMFDPKRDTDNTDEVTIIDDV